MSHTDRAARHGEESALLIAIACSAIAQDMGVSPDYQRKAVCAAVYAAHHARLALDGDWFPGTLGTHYAGRRLRWLGPDEDRPELDGGR